MVVKQLVVGFGRLLNIDVLCDPIPWGLLIHVVAIQVCLHSGKEEIVSLGQIQVVEGPVFKHLDVLICQDDSEVKLLVISAEDGGVMM